MKNIIIGILISFAFLLASYSSTKQSQVFVDVITGESELVCFIDNEYKTINTNKIKSFDESTGYWTFENGYAKNCEVF